MSSCGQGTPVLLGIWLVGPAGAVIRTYNQPGRQFGSSGVPKEDKETCFKTYLKTERLIDSARRSGMMKWAQSVTICTVIVLVGWLLWSSKTKPTPELQGQTAARYLHLLIPSNSRNVNLCKTLLSAAALDYPIPTAVNWNQSFDDASLVAGGSHLAKISGILDYLNTLGDERNDDLVLAVDAYDVWFQLRPVVMIHRYYELIRMAKQRIIARLSRAAVEAEKIEQSVIFSTQKRCWPREADDPGCFAIPESTLPKDVYGPETDTDAGTADNPYLKYRPRYLNSGVSMGDVAGMKRLFRHALQRMQQDRNFGSDQNIFAQILG
ncbi:uncharacterized protein LY89DRAFT_364300 [Mollisia scopiformis]|uniref:Uncharacterized protein n=1 Tax=Mollisia scopiformis TaxID=149040 RepID=A0A132B4P1_MOLSC|nr:uncharacterized protein LY89DRAFT_364300 [Mollisia scopiformis]KUJ07372.1 hypothetical protein LY89DRAFT_364300 [Mollisia scopiformis]